MENVKNKTWAFAAILISSFFVILTVSLIAGLLLTMTGCSDSLILKPTKNTLEEPTSTDTLTRIGYSYECDTRQATIQNPMENAIWGRIDCGCGEDLVRVPPRTDAITTIKSHKSLQGNNMCSFTWSIAGQSMPVIAKHE